MLTGFERKRQVRTALYNQVADRIYERMEKLGMSQMQLARALGYRSRIVPARALRGNNLELSTIADIADVFGCKVVITLEDQDL